MKRIFYIRHGESEFNREHKWAGLADTPLTEKGRQQATLAGQTAKQQGLSFDTIVASPLSRAHDTAKHVAKEVGYPIEMILLHPKLVERSYGALEGQNNKRGIGIKYALNEAAIDDIEGVETLLEFQKRVDKMLTYLHNMPDETILVVGHGAFGRALRRAINQEPLSHRGKSFDNATLIQLL